MVPDYGRLEKGAAMRKDLPWMSFFIHVLGVADTYASADEVSAEVLGLAAGDRHAVEAARIHLISSRGRSVSRERWGAR